MWTHIYDGILKLVGLILSILIIEPIFPLLGYPVFVCIAVLTIYGLLYYYLLSYLSSYLYCRITLKIPIQLSQLKLIRKAISPLVAIKWPTLKEVQEAQVENRYALALEKCESWLKNNPNRLFKKKQ